MLDLRNGISQNDIRQECRGRSEEQQKVIKLFLGGTGCLDSFSGLTDEAYEQMVMQKVASVDFKRRALDKIGLDESQVNEIEPVHLENYYFDKKKAYSKYSRNLRRWISSAYQISWIFFSATEVYLYQFTFHMDEDGYKELTEEYFYKDIVNFAAITENIEVSVVDAVNCIGQATYRRGIIANALLSVKVSGASFECATVASDYFERSVQGMKAKLREKKNEN